ncbi:MAG: hypothetical protein AAB373_01850 [Patescibacteria group bacterium]
MPVVDYLYQNKKFRSKETFKTEVNRVIQSLVITLTVLIVLLGAVFLGITSENAQKGYALKQAKLLNDELKSENSDLSTKVNESTTFAKVEENPKLDKMTATEAKTYITEEDNLVN